jgi:hypothetical protein
VVLLEQFGTGLDALFANPLGPENALFGFETVVFQGVKNLFKPFVSLDFTSYLTFFDMINPME